MPIQFTGLRDGEKIHEELWEPWEQPQPTENPHILKLTGLSPFPLDAATVGAQVRATGQRLRPAGVARVHRGIRAGLCSGTGRRFQRPRATTRRNSNQKISRLLLGGNNECSFSAPDIGEREIEYVTRALRSTQLSMGSWLTRFEEAFAEYMGTRYAVAANSGTSALHMCVQALRLGPKDEAITTSFSFVASVNCLLYEGVLPTFVDIEPTSLNIDPELVRAFLRKQCFRKADGTVLNRVTGRTVKALLPVHVFGLPCAMDELMSIANEYGLLVLEDACEAIGAEIRGRRVGTFGKAAVFAFYPNKQMTTGEGGMIVTNDSNVADLCRSIRNQGRDADGRWLRHVRLGYNYRLSDIHAALGLAQLERINELFGRARRGGAQIYRAAASVRRVAASQGRPWNSAKLVRLCGASPPT